MVEDFKFDKQFKNIGIDKSAVKKTRAVGSAIEVIDVSEEESKEPETKDDHKEDSADSVSASKISDDSLEELKKMQQKSAQDMNSRIDTIKTELNKVLSQFHEKIEALAAEFKENKKSVVIKLNQIEEKFSDAKVESFNSKSEEKKPESNQDSSNKKEDFTPGDKKVAVENIFDFSNAKDFKRV